jgi:tRNA-specific 2-thiouridylase
MNLLKKKVRALGLCSGGLDSILSALLLRKQKISVCWVTFETPFFSSNKARRAAKRYNIPLKIERITPIFLEMLKNPPCGYGRWMNPCMDCHALMFRLAGSIMRKEGFDFIFSGEVLGQRPMSQTRPSLRYVEKKSGVEGYILRPLSAKKLPETIPEKTGLIERDLLYGWSGRSRKPQLGLAQKYGVIDYPAPAGGCLLTDSGYTDRLKDFFKYQKTWTEDELHLLKYGRHFRLENDCKIIVGRTKQDNDKIETHYNPLIDIMIKVVGYPGPLVLVPKGADRKTIDWAASVCAGYGKAPANIPVDIEIAGPKGLEIITRVPIRPSNAIGYLV